MSADDRDQSRPPEERATEEGEVGAARQRYSGTGRPSERRRPGTSRMEPLSRPGERPGTRAVAPGEVLHAEEPVEINAGKEVSTLRVQNTSDRPVQVGSHYHFFEVNPALEFDRNAAYGLRLNVLSGGAMRFEPGAEEEVELIPIGGQRIVAGLRGEVGGELDG